MEREFPEISNREIERLSGIDHKTIKKWRKKPSANAGGEIPHPQHVALEASDQKPPPARPGSRIWPRKKEMNSQLRSDSRLRGLNPLTGESSTGTKVVSEYSGRTRLVSIPKKRQRGHSPDFSLRPGRAPAPLSRRASFEGTGQPKPPRPHSERHSVGITPH